MKPVRKYLERWAEPEAAWAAHIPGRFCHAVIIPAYGEGPSLDRAVASVPQRETLTIVHLNRTAASPADVETANQRALARLCDQYPVLDRDVLDRDVLDRDALEPNSEHHARSRMSRHRTPAGELVILQSVMPARQGVGLARKTGCDLALALWAEGRLESPWLHCTDADVELPADYLDHDSAEGAALLHPFVHISGGEDALRYEIALRLYVLGLHRARSPYAFHTIGSTMAIHARAYGAVRGVPKTEAGEDFYLLNKVAKQGAVIAVSGQPIRIEGRTSQRVPFGTGRAMTKARAGVQPPAYDPAIFARLAELLGALEHALSRGESLELPPSLAEPAHAIGLPAAFEAARAQAPDTARLRRRLDEWLDASRTRKLVHLWRDADYPSVSVETALEAFDPTLPRDLAAAARVLAERELALTPTGARLDDPRAQQRETA